MAADLATASYAEKGLRALENGDIPGAVGAFASIDTEGWTMLRDRFPGFPAQITAIAGDAIALPGPALSVSVGTEDLDDEPNWANLGRRD